MSNPRHTIRHAPTHHCTGSFDDQLAVIIQGPGQVGSVTFTAAITEGRPLAFKHRSHCVIACDGKGIAINSLAVHQNGRQLVTGVGRRYNGQLGPLFHAGQVIRTGHSDPAVGRLCHGHRAFGRHIFNIDIVHVSGGSSGVICAVNNIHDELVLTCFHHFVAGDQTGQLGSVQEHSHSLVHNNL